MYDGFMKHKDKMDDNNGTISLSEYMYTIIEELFIVVSSGVHSGVLYPMVMCRLVEYEELLRESEQSNQQLLNESQDRLRMTEVS